MEVTKADIQRVERKIRELNKRLLDQGIPLFDSSDVPVGVVNSLKSSTNITFSRSGQYGLIASSGGAAALTVKEADGAPADTAVTVIQVPNGGGLTDNGAGDVTLNYEIAGAVTTHAGLSDPHPGYRLESVALKISHVIPFVSLAEDAIVETLLPLPGVCVGESGEHGTFAALRGKAICGTAGTGTNTIIIEADDNPAFSSATTLFTLNLGTSTEVDDTSLDNTWASGDNFVRARMTAVGATAPKNLAVFFYFSEEVF